jgi:hypothetical protein
MRRLVFVASLVLASTSARADFCPSYSSTSSDNPGDCGVASAPGTNPSISAWQAFFATAAAGPAGAGWTGPTIPDIDDGCPNPVKESAHFPCELVKAIAMQESGWVQFCAPTEPSDQVGMPSRTIISSDCGYGVVQVTSGMHVGDTADFDRDSVAADPLYDIEVGLQILAGKWSTTPCVGNNVPDIVEDWYLATWAYNGFAYSNNPNNPNFDSMRGVCDPNVGCGARPYQELIWGWMEHPPADGRWPVLAPAYPDLAQIPSASGATVPQLDEPSCAGPTDCTSTRAVHHTSCGASPDLGGPDLEARDLGGLDAASDASEMRTARNGCACQLAGRPQSVSLFTLACVMLGLGFALYCARRRVQG